MEIEIRAFIENISDFKNELAYLGALYKSQIHIIDYWFCDKNSYAFEQVQQHEPGSYGLRIRKTMTEDKTIVELNCKVLEKLGDHNAFHEYETCVENFEQTKQILEKIGFKIFCTVDKKRTIYSYQNCSINIDDIKGFKPAVELEIISANEGEHTAELRNLLDKLHIKEENKIEKSITFLYMKEHSFK